MNTAAQQEATTRAPLPLDESTIKRLIRRIVDRRFEWGIGRFRRKGESIESITRRMERAAAVAIIEFEWRDGWDQITDGPYHVFGPKQRLKTAKDVPTRVVHTLMCTMKDD